jgi:hypothetical protein
LHNPDKTGAFCTLSLLKMSTNEFFTSAEIEKFTLPNEEEYRDIDRLHATIAVDGAEQWSKKRNVQR